MMAKQIPVCTKCGSDDVLSDAYAAWDFSTQEWVLAQTFDKGAYCNKCDGEARLEFKTVPPAQQVLFELKDDDRPVSERNVASPL